MKILGILFIVTGAFAIVDGLGIAGNKDADYTEVFLGGFFGFVGLAMRGKI